MADVTINLHNSNNDDTSVSGGQTVVFHNQFNNKSVTLTLPQKQGGGSPFTGNPPTQLTIDPGGDSPVYTVKNNIENENFTYSWDDGPHVKKAGPRSGRMVVD